MNEVEEKFKKFSLDENMRKMFSHSSVEIEEIFCPTTSFLITTVVIDPTGDSRRTKRDEDAKLV
jgi:hypothetical protein